MKFLFLIALFQAVAISASARTWYVEKDGSGDFTVIQDALDAAASGDTLRIGPGRFVDFREYETNGGLQGIIAMIQVPEITFLGAGADQTIIGPSEYTWDGEEPIPRGVVCIAQTPPGGLELSGLSFENMVSGVYVENAVGLTVEDCRFAGGSKGVRSFEDVVVQRCEFSDLRFGVLVDGPADSAIVEDCAFSACRQSVQFQWMNNCFVRRCQMTVPEGSPSAGVGFSGAGGGVYDCQIMGIEFSITITSSLNVELKGNHIVSPGICIDSDSELFVAEDNVLQSTGSVATIILYTRGLPHTIRNNHILRGTGLAVRVPFHHGDPGYVLDMSGNWWGTTERDSIAAWIHDGNDVIFPPLECRVDFEPFSSVPLPTERESLGGFRSLFR